MTNKTSKWTAASLAAVAVAAMAWMTMPAAAQQQAAVSDQALIGPGKTTYAQKCSHCHGPNMVTAGHGRTRLARIPGRQRALRHHGEAGQEQQDAAVGATF